MRGLQGSIGSSRYLVGEGGLKVSVAGESDIATVLRQSLYHKLYTHTHSQSHSCGVSRLLGGHSSITNSTHTHNQSHGCGVSRLPGGHSSITNSTHTHNQSHGCGVSRLPGGHSSITNSTHRHTISHRVVGSAGCLEVIAPSQTLHTNTHTVSHTAVGSAGCLEVMVEIIE